MLARQGDQVVDQSRVRLPIGECDGSGRRCSGVVQAIDVVEAPGLGVEQRRVLGGVQQGRAGQHLRVRVDGLPVRPRAGGLPGDGGPVADDGRVVAGLDAVVQDAREIGHRAREQRGGDPLRAGPAGP